MRTGPICISEPTKTTRCKYTQPRKERGKGSGLMTLPWGSQPPVGGSALISLTDTPPHPRKIHIKVREKEREREKKKNGTGGGVLQGKGPFPSSVWDPWWNRAAQGAGLLKNRSKVKKRHHGYTTSYPLGDGRFRTFPDGDATEKTPPALYLPSR